MPRQDEDSAIGFRVSTALKKKAEERATSCGLSLSDYLKGLIAADVHGAQAFYAQRAAMNSHMTLLMVATLLKREGGDKALVDLWGPMEETITGTYGPFAPMPAELMDSLRGSKKPFFMQLYNFFRHHALELKNGK